ncbi:MAG: sigma 54-interacting transcriptional regulator, partial [Deltaproteobacteria bacterium]|nr:sigma 54-interacting transcriptional regulator [Deltaproteobacteria bacterium]
WMSGRHATLRRTAQGFRFADLGSTNGSRLNGQPAREALLRDGDVLELGHTFFLFRSAVPRRHDGPPDLDLEEAPPLAEGLGTLLSAPEAEHGRLATLARSGVSIVLGGETGAGKEVAARALHALSGRAGPFVAVNCGALPPNLVESELFGHKKGAFSGAGEDRAGLVRSADQGTLLLDEIGDLPPAAQAALLRVLQEGEVLPIGAARPVKVDVRILSATHRDLDALVAAGTFRADLLARLQGFTARLWPLRERREDLGLLLGAILRQKVGPAAAQVQLAPEAVRALLAFAWPKNIRELAKALETALVLAGSGPVELIHLPEAVRRPLPAAPLAASPGTQVPAPLPAETTPPTPPRPLSADEEKHRDELVLLLREHKGNIAAVGRATGKARMQVQRWLKRYGLDPGAFRE